ncbi:MAG: uroporphyrinogen decarboxylase family protein [Caldicoprobacterales bacterium]|jgi:uroporphyrinogen-III decarboxylase|nr:hypothetical protein [Clostridiales bacterium]
MTNRERFKRIFRYEPIDYLPAYFFGTWKETKARWLTEGLTGDAEELLAGGNLGPQIEGMGPDWEPDIWSGHGLVNFHPIGNYPYEELSRTKEYRIYRNSLGAVIKESLTSNSIPHTIKPALEPTRKSWEAFRRFLDPTQSNRYPADLPQLAQAYSAVDRPLVFMGGSLYGYLRDWMGVENISLLMYDDPELMREMVSYMADFFMAVYEPVLRYVTFDLCYIFEDCCGANGPLFSPRFYNEFFSEPYQRLFKFYRDRGVEFIMLDSDGYVEPMITCWLDSGVDILFPMEIGTWNTDLCALRKQYGKRLRMFGGVNKHLISQGGPALERHLDSYKCIVQEGGFLPIPDHRIPPECSYQKFLAYLETFNRIYNG